MRWDAYISSETIRSGLRRAAESMARHPCYARTEGLPRRVTFAVPPTVVRAAHVLGVDLPDACEVAAREAGFDAWTLEFT